MGISTNTFSPESIQGCSNEFKSGAIKLLEKHGVIIRRTVMKYKHTHMAFIEAINKLLTEQLFKVQMRKS